MIFCPPWLVTCCHGLYPVALATQPEDEVMKEEEKDPKIIIAKANTNMDDEYDNRKGSDSNYYSIAHTLRETVSEQPSIMAFGKLKEYQVGGRVALLAGQQEATET